MQKLLPVKKRTARYTAALLHQNEVFLVFAPQWSRNKQQPVGSCAKCVVAAAGETAKRTQVRGIAACLTLALARRRESLQWRQNAHQLQKLLLVQWR